MKKIWEVPAVEELDVSNTFGGPEPIAEIDGPFTGEYWPMGGS